MSRHRFWKNALVSRRPVRHTTPLRVERLEARDLPAAPVPADIVSWYRAEGDAADFVGNNNGTLVGGATFTAGKVGQAFLFDGDDYVSIPDHSSLEPGSNFTIEAWVNPSEPEEGESGHGRPIAEKCAGNGNAYTFETTDSPYGPNAGLQFVVWIGGVQQNFLQTPPGALQYDTWQHVAATYDGAWLRIFVDGVQQAESQVSGAIDNVDAPTVIGLNSVAAFAWKGAIDELSFYSRALSQAELQTIVDADSEGKELPNTYDAAGDFSITGNPNGAWSYGWSQTLGGEFTKDISTRSGHPHPELQSWDGPISSFFPVISKNIANATVVVGTVTWQPLQMVNHPGPNGEYSVLRWTAPKAGEVEFSTSFSGADSTTTDVHVLFNETTIPDCNGNVNGFGAGPTFSQSLVVELGDTIDFVVGFGNNGYSNDSTGVDALITYADENPPTPDLSVTISDAPDPVLIGDPVTYTVTVTNNGPLDATGATVVALGPPGQQFNSVTIPIGDLASGATRSFQVVFTPAAVGTFSATAIVTANESDSNPTNNSFTETTVVASRSIFELAQAQYEVREGEKFAVLTVRRTGNLLNSASVEYITVNGTAGQRGIGTGLSRIADFTTTSGELFFRSRSNVATIRVPIGDDLTVEPDETFRVVLSNPSAGTALGPISSAEVIIHDNDPTVSFLDSSSERNEGVAGRGLIEVRLHPASNQTVTVAFAPAGGSAIAGTDYSLVGSSLTFQPGETRKFIQFTNAHDTLFEGNETAFIELTSATNAFLGTQARHRVTILDDDPEPPPPDPGDTLLTALSIDLQTRPRQTYHQTLGRTEMDVFKVELAGNERLVLDVDPSSLLSGLPGLPSSKLRIFAADGRLLSTIGASAEPEGGQITNNAATLFQAEAAGGTYYVQLSTTAPAKGYGYSLGFHRIGVSENVPSPEQLNVPGPMYAWYDGEDTVGITGPTGYGFTLEGPWEHRVLPPGNSILKSQRLTLDAGDQFTLRSPQGLDLPLVANSTFTISTKSQRWGDVVGVVTTDAIRFPVGLSIVPINDLLADVFGSSFATVSLLSGDWRISLGGSTFRAPAAGSDTKEKVDQLLPGVPYLRKFGGSTVDARVGGLNLTSSHTPMHWILDPADPMMFVKIPPGPVGAIKGAALAVSMHGLLKFKPQDEPDPEIDAGVTEFAGHIFATARLQTKLLNVPLEFDVDADVVLNVDADRDGLLLGGLGDVSDVFDILQGDFSQVRAILSDLQLGANGQVSVSVPREYVGGGDVSMEGRGSLVLNGLTESVWVRAEGNGQAFRGMPIQNGGGSYVYEGLLDFNGEFFYALTTSADTAGIELVYKFIISHEGISASVTGSVEWSAKIDFGAGTVSGKAKATITAEIAIEIDDDGDLHLSGSVSARGRLTARIAGDVKELFDDSIEANVRSRGFRFRFPRGVGSLDLDLF